MRARRDIRQRLRPSAEIIVAIGEIGALADQADRKGAHAPTLADARVEHGRFAARIGGDDEQCVRLIDSGDGGVEQVARPAPCWIEHRAVLPAVKIDDAEPRHQILEGEGFLDRGKVADDRTDALHLGRVDFGGDGVEGVAPGGRI
jgi:hypothetical protein